MRCSEEPPECNEEANGRRTRSAPLEPDVDDDGVGGGSERKAGGAAVPCDASAHGDTGSAVLGKHMFKNKSKLGTSSSIMEPPGQNVSKETLSNHFAKCGKSRVDPSCIDEVPAGGADARASNVVGRGAATASGVGTGTGTGTETETETETAPPDMDSASLNASRVHRVVKPNGNTRNSIVDAESMAKVASAPKPSKGRDPSVVIPLSCIPGSSTNGTPTAKAKTTGVMAAATSNETSRSKSPESQSSKNHLRMAEPPSSSSSVVSHGRDHYRNYDTTSKSQGHAAQPSIHNIHMNARGHVYLDGEDDVEVSSALSSALSKNKTKNDNDDDNDDPSPSRSKSPEGRLDSSGKKNKGMDPKSTVYHKGSIGHNHPDDELSKSSAVGSGHYHPAYKAVVSGTAIRTNKNNGNNINHDNDTCLRTARDASTIGGDSNQSSVTSNQSFNASRYPSRQFPTPVAATSYKGIKNGIANVMSNDRVGGMECKIDEGQQHRHQDQLHRYMTQRQQQQQKQPPPMEEEQRRQPRRDPTSSSSTHYDFEQALDSSESQATFGSYNASIKAITERKFNTAKGRVMHFDKASYGIHAGNDGGNANRQRENNPGVNNGRRSGRSDTMHRDEGGRDYYDVEDVPDMASVAASIDRSLNSIDGDDLIDPSECGGEDCGTADAHYGGDRRSSGSGGVGRRDSGKDSVGSLGSHDTQNLRRTVTGHSSSGGRGGGNHSKGGGASSRDMVNSRRRASIEKAKDSDIESLSGGRRGGGYHNGGNGNNNRVSFADQNAQLKSSSSSRKSKENNTKEPSFQTPASSWKRPSSLSGGGALTDTTNGGAHRASSSKSKGGHTSFVKKYSSLLAALAVTMCVSIGSMFGSSSLSLSGLVSGLGGDASMARNQRELKNNGEQVRDVPPAKGIMDNVHPTTKGQFNQNAGPDVSGNGNFDWSKVPPHLRGYYAKIFGLQEQQQQIQQQAQQRQQQQQELQEQQQVMPQVYDRPMPELGITDLQNELASIQNEIDQQYININAANAIQNVGNEGMSVNEMAQEIPPSNQGQASTGEIPMMSYDDWKRQQDIEEGRAQEQSPLDANAMAQHKQLQQQAADEAARQQQQAAEEEAARQREQAEAEEKAMWEKQQGEEAAARQFAEKEAARLRAEEEEAARQRAAEEAANEKRELEQLAMIEQEVARRKEGEEAAKQEEEAKAREEAEMAAEAERAATRAKEQEVQRVAAEEEQRKNAEAQTNVGEEEARRQEKLEEKRRQEAAEARRRQQEAEKWMKKNAEVPEEDATITQEPEEGKATAATLDQLQSEIADLMAMMQQKAGRLRKRG